MGILFEKGNHWGLVSTVKKYWITEEGKKVKAVSKRVKKFGFEPPSTTLQCNPRKHSLEASISFAPPFYQIDRRLSLLQSDIRLSHGKKKREDR